MNRFRNRQRHLRAEARFDAQVVGVGEHVAHHSARPIEHVVAGFRRFGPGTVADHHVRPVRVVFEDHRRSAHVIARSHGQVAPTRTSRRGIKGGIALPHGPVVRHFLGRPDPDGRLAARESVGRRRGAGQWIEPAAARRIVVQTDEIHPHFGHLTEIQFIIVGVPPVGPLEEVVERLNPAQRKERLAALVQLGQLQRNPPIRHDVAVDVKAHTQGFCEPVRAVERADVVAADDQHNRLLSGVNRFEQVLLFVQRSDRFIHGRRYREPVKYRPVLPGHDNTIR